MDVENHTFQIFKPIDRDTYVRLMDHIPTLVGAFSISADEQPNLCVSLFKNIILLRDASKTYHTLELTFQIKLAILYENQEDVTSEIIGFTLLSQTNQQVSFYGIDAGNFVHVLAKLLNMKGFHEMFKPIRKLGRGNFATVYQALRLTDHKKFAVKAFSKQNSYCAKNGKESLINELSLLRDLNIQPHPNVLRLESVYQSDNSIYVVLELLEGKTLLQALYQKAGQLMTHQEVKNVVEGLLKGLAHLHKNRVMHRDIKPENIMIRKGTLEPVIVDFGLATNVDLPQYLFFRCGTPGYVAPEIIQLTQSVHLEPTCDIFSLGAIFHIMLMNRPLFEGIKYEQVYKSNKQFKINLQSQIYSKIGTNAKDLMKQMLVLNPFMRITAVQALKHPYFTQIQEQKIKKTWFSSKVIDSPLRTQDASSVCQVRKKKKFFFF